MTPLEIRSKRNPYDLKETIKRLKHYLEATHNGNARELLEKAIAKAKESTHFAERFESAFISGSTCEYRELLSDFGDYWAKTSDVIPYYPHHDAVNGIDSAMLHIRIGDGHQAIADYNRLHNQ